MSLSLPSALLCRYYLGLFIPSLTAPAFCSPISYNSFFPQKTLLLSSFLSFSFCSQTFPKRNHIPPSPHSSQTRDLWVVNMDQLPRKLEAPMGTCIHVKFLCPTTLISRNILPHSRAWTLKWSPAEQE